MQALVERLMLDEFAPPAVLVDANGDILYLAGHTLPFLEPAAGRANWNLHVMAREGLRGPLGQALLQRRQLLPERRHIGAFVKLNFQIPWALHLHAGGRFNVSNALVISSKAGLLHIVGGLHILLVPKV